MDSKLKVSLKVIVIIKTTVAVTTAITNITTLNCTLHFDFDYSCWMFNAMVVCNSEEEIDWNCSHTSYFNFHSTITMVITEEEIASSNFEGITTTVVITFN